MRSFWIRMINLFAIVGVLFAYHIILTVRSSEEQAAKLHAELESAKLELENDRQLLASEGYTFTNTAGTQEMLPSGEAEETASSGGGAYRDGVYAGEAEGFGGPISLEVTVTDGIITDIQILSAEGEDGTYLDMAKGIIPEIIESQSPEVDTISGATFSSTGIKNAVIQALGKAGE